MLKIRNKETIIKFIDLFLISALSLYFEILFIRWLPSNIQIVAYFTNLVLISAFLGLGLGCLLANEKHNLMPYFPLSILLLTVIGIGFSHLPFSVGIESEYFLGFYMPNGQNYIVLLLIIFIFNALFFMILGQTLGRALKFFKPLVAYSINIGGSILGIFLFWIFSCLSTPPIVWFGTGIMLSLWFIRKTKKNFVFAGCILMLTICFINQFSERVTWSPYYKIDVRRLTDNTRKNIGYEISANKTQHQYAFDLSDYAQVPPLIDNFKKIYRFPYNFVVPKDVLVIGAGSGNDVTIALEQGAESVDAVEIDPIIASMGVNLHAQKPYLNKKVNVFIDDARSYLNKATKKYDLIVFGYLDSHRLLSQFSTVRLDNFIYTVESFREVKNRLKPDGLLVVTYRIFSKWIAGRLQNELKEVFGDNLIVYKATTYSKNDTIIFCAGQSVHKMLNKKFDGFTLTDEYGKIDVPPATDDWPYLYLKERTIPMHYVVILLCILAVSFSVIFSMLKDKIQNMKHYHFFFLGAAFMLLETTAITRFALLYGSTWVVNTAVIISILSMILFANFVASRIKFCKLGTLYIFLMMSIILEWGINTSVFLSFNSRVLTLVFSSAVLALPLFFAGLIFARSFKETNDPPGVFAFNLAGAVLGGMLEYTSMALGFKALSFVVLAMYIISYISFRKKLI